MTDAEIRTVVEQLYAAAGAGDWDNVAALLTDDFVIREAAGLPYAGTWHGKDALRQVYMLVMGAWQDPKVAIHALTVGDGHAVGLLTLTVTAPGTGERHSFPIAEMFRIDNGRIAEIQPYYFDTAAVTKALARVA
jgi:ketosteroid isomerase-like protein